MIDLSIIIVSYNTCTLLRDCLVSVAAARGGLRVETFVVDNASRDGSPDMVAAEFPHVFLRRNVTNRGFAHANNVALPEAGGRYVMLLNSDTVVRPAALETLVAFMDGHPRAGYCGPKLRNGDGTHQPSARRFPTVLSSTAALRGWARRNPQSRHVLDLHAEHGADATLRADWLCGAALLARAEAIRDVGLLDDGFFLYFEETDWCRRMASAGWEGWYVADAEIVHLGGQSVVHAGQARPFAGDHPEHWVASSRRYLRKHHGMSAMLISAGLQVALYTLIWLRHRWRSGATSRDKARTAAAALQYLLRSPKRAPDMG